MRKWKCVENSNNNNYIFTIGKIYETEDDGSYLDDNMNYNGYVEPWNMKGVKFEEVKQLSLSDLKPCMVVKLRNENIYLISEYKNDIAIIDKFLYLDSNDFTEDLKSLEGEEFDIIKVYGFSNITVKSIEISIENRKLLWECIENHRKN